MTRLLLRVREAAEALGVDVRTVYRLIDSSQIQAVHVGRAVRIPPDALEAYVERLRQE